MILAALFGLFESLLYDVVLLFIGKILSNSNQLRAYLGLKSEGEHANEFSETSHWVENIGKTICIIAVVSGIVSIITTIIILMKM